MSYIIPVLLIAAALWLITRRKMQRQQSHYFFGDSITQGYGVSNAEGYVAVYASLIGAARVDRMPTPNPMNGDISDATLDWPKTGESSITVTRDGGGGRPVVAVNSAGLLRDYWTTVHPAGRHDVLVIQCGINDAIQNAFKSETPEQFASNLERLVQLAKDDADRVYLLAPTYASQAVQPSVAPYIQVMRDVGKKTGTKVIEPPTDEAWYGADIYHPNAAGHAAIAGAVYKAVQV